MRFVSPAFCRPNKLVSKKEIKELVREVAKVREKISQVLHTQISVRSYTFLVTHSLHLTMVDEKIGGILTETSSSKNLIYKDYSKIMNCLQSF